MAGTNSPDKKGSNSSPKPPKIQEKSLERMEALLKHSAQGIHVLFDHASVAEIMGRPNDEKDFFDFQKMKLAQDAMTALIAKKSYFEKLDFLRDLDRDSYTMLVRTYFHLVENNVRSETPHQH